MPYEVDILPAPFLGIDQKSDPEHLDDLNALWIQDGFCDIPGRIRRRGPWGTSKLPASVDLKVLRAASNVSRDGSEYAAILGSDPGSTEIVTYLYVTDPAFAANTGIVLQSMTGAGSADACHGWMTPDPRGNLILSTAYSVDSLEGDNQSWLTEVYLYSGTTTSGTISASTSIATTQGTTTVTGVGSTFVDDVEPGAWLLDTNAMPLGRVREVTSQTAMELETGAWETSSAATASIKPHIRWHPQHGKGTITVANGGTAVSGVNTKFLSLAKLGDCVASDWALFRRSDGEYIGDVSAIADNNACTISTAQIAMVNEAFIAIPVNNTTMMRMDGNATRASMVMPGVVTANFAGRVWFMNNPATSDRARINTDLEQSSRVIFTAVDNTHDIDWSPDGDWFDLPSNIAGNSPILEALATDNALLVFKREEVVAITGRTPQEFTPDIIYNDGALTPYAVTAYEGGAVWAGQRDIYWYDGRQIHKLGTPRLGNTYGEMVSTIVVGDADVHNDKACVVERVRNHVFVYFDNATYERGVHKESSGSTPTQFSLAINMETGAITTLSNVGARAVFAFNSTTERKWYATLDDNAFDAGNQTAGTDVYDTDDLFETTGTTDSLTVEGMTAGPDFYVETRRWSGGAEHLKKKVKRLRAQYLSAGAGLKVDVITSKDRGNVNGTLLATMDAKTTFGYDDILLSPTVDEIVGFRFYEDTGVTDASLGEQWLWYKTQRSTRT
jgi:hypothetical protein